MIHQLEVQVPVVDVPLPHDQLAVARRIFVERDVDELVLEERFDR